MPLLQFPANGAPSSLNSPPAKSPVPLRRGQSIRASVAAFPEAIPTDCRPKPSLYEILKVSPTASFGEIKAAYRALAKIHHPDQARSGDDDGGREFMEIRDAYERLSIRL
ncbi:unnamed protein product [Linum tenue]|uniref:J domain-containing protein n=1 Tax=Linum tenue TaxID=586396 RepID=A0AAV0MDG1_9ROSI|nr:unnamed protein product [Linum tenue]